jgi:hypothetical protein
METPEGEKADCGKGFQLEREEAIIPRVGITEEKRVPLQ